VKRSRWSLLLFLLCLAAAEPDSSREDLEANRRLLEKWRADPEHYARLHRDLRAFWALPTERRQRLRQLDRDLHETAPGEQKRLLAVLERYSLWLERLPESDRQRLEAAPNSTEKLKLIREIRDRQWLDRLPMKIREELRSLPPEQQLKRVQSLRKEEARHRIEWRRPRVIRPMRLAEYPAEVQTFVEQSLRPRLSAAEQKQLDDAEGKPAVLVHTLVDLSDRHPLLPALRSGPVTRYEELPASVQHQFPLAQLETNATWQAVQPLQGKWPDFALALTDLMRNEKKGPLPPLGASRPREFPSETQAFLEKRAPQMFTKGDMARLVKTEGKWPEYPRLLLELARKHHLHVPGMTLPGPRELWDGVRPGG
jgi:hypothetical protein